MMYQERVCALLLGKIGQATTIDELRKISVETNAEFLKQRITDVHLTEISGAFHEREKQLRLIPEPSAEEQQRIEDYLMMSRVIRAARSQAELEVIEARVSSAYEREDISLRDRERLYKEIAVMRAMIEKGLIGGQVFAALNDPMLVTEAEDIISDRQTDLIERVAQVICDTGGGRRYGDIGEAFKDVYRTRARALRDAGLLRTEDSR